MNNKLLGLLVVVGLQVVSSKAMDSESGWVDGDYRPGSRLVSGTFNPKYQYVLQLGNGKYKIGWIYVSKYDDAVLVSYTGARPGNYEIGNNFVYVNPAYPSVKLLNGLYYWKSQLSAGEKVEDLLGKHGNVAVKNNPNSSEARYFPNLRGYSFDGSSKIDDTTTGLSPLSLEDLKE